MRTNYWSNKYIQSASKTVTKDAYSIIFILYLDAP